VRVVGGSLRGRRIEAPADDSVRPTSDRARQALFDILTQGRQGNVVQDAEVIDAFAGSGALGIEALSRGAAFVTFLEKDRAAVKLIAANLKALGLEAQGSRAQAQVLLSDATRPPVGRRQASLVMLDPPYGSGAGPTALAALVAGGWLAPGALATLEVEREEEVAVPEGFTLLDERQYGRAKILLLQRS
jgi:16S rRNA (guanine966-N2)-methyltransferase